MKILITAALGVVGRGIANSIRMSEKYSSANIIGLDIISNKYGLKSKLYNEIIKSPRYDNNNYTDFIKLIIKEKKPDAVLINNEFEVLKLSNLNLKNALLINEKFANIAISKEKLFAILDEKNFIPKSLTISRDDILSGNWAFLKNKEKWIRSVREGSTGGEGAFKAKKRKEVINWVKKKKKIKRFQISEFLPGRNLACTLLFVNGELINSVCGERKSYMLSDLVQSGITGYTNHGFVFNDRKLVEYCLSIIKEIPGGDKLSGAITIDLKEDVLGIPKVTEINLRYIGFTYAFALSGYNIVEAHLDYLFEKKRNTKFSNSKFEFYRSIDGHPEVFRVND